MKSWNNLYVRFWLHLHQPVWKVSTWGQRSPAFQPDQLWEEGGGGGEDIYYPVVAQRLFQDGFSTAASLKPW